MPPVLRHGSCLTVVLLLACLPACTAYHPLGVRPVTVEQRAWLLSGKPVRGENAAPLSEPDDAVMELTPEMVTFAHRAVPERASDRAKARALMSAIIHPGTLGLEYQPTASYTAQEVYVHRRANCLAFTSFTVALMREVGLRAHFNEVDIPYIWDMADNSTLVLYKHINAVVDFRHGPDQVVDIAMEEYDTSYQQRRIPDTLALAQHYNNRAMEFLTGDDLREAIRYMIAALDLKPAVPYFWSNLGAIYRRSGNLDAAELAYRLALHYGPSDLVAISNSARLYEQLGNQEMARRLNERAAYFRARNPYYRYHQGLQAFANHDYRLALEHTRAAIRHYQKEHRFYFLQGAIYSRLGDDEQAEKNLRKALDLTADPGQNARYRRKMDLLLSANHIRD